MEKNLILFPDLKGSAGSTVESTHYQDVGEGPAGCQKEPEAEECGGRVQGHPRSLTSEDAPRSPCPFDSKSGDTHTHKWDEIRLDKLEKKCLPSLSLNVVLHVLNSLMFLFPPLLKPPRLFPEMQFRRSHQAFPSSPGGSLALTFCLIIPWYLSKSEPQQKTQTRESVPHFHKGRRKPSGNLSNTFFFAWVFGCLDPLFPFSDSIFSWKGGGKKTIYAVVLKERKLLEQKVPSLHG